MRYYETAMTDVVVEKLIALSVDWEKENSCSGYRANEREDIEGNRVFVAEEEGEIVGYLFGHEEQAQKMRSIMADGTPYFEVMELYVVPGFRSRGIGKKLFLYAEEQVKDSAGYLVLSTATQNHRAILHFYIDEVGMEFWSARLYKKIGTGEI